MSTLCIQQNTGNELHMVFYWPLYFTCPLISSWSVLSSAEHSNRDIPYIFIKIRRDIEVQCANVCFMISILSIKQSKLLTLSLSLSLTLSLSLSLHKKYKWGNELRPEWLFPVIFLAPAVFESRCDVVNYR